MPVLWTGIGCPRRSKQNETLPSARLVSWKLFRSRPQRSHVHTHLLMTVGQFLDHDLTKTAVTKLSKDATGKIKIIRIFWVIRAQRQLHTGSYRGGNYDDDDGDDDDDDDEILVSS